MVIRLPEPVWPTAFTIWHISEAVSPSGEVSSAPKEFAVSVSLCLALLGGARPRGKAVPETCFSRRLLSDSRLGLAAAEHRIPRGGHWGLVGFCASGGFFSASWPRLLEHALNAP